MVSVGRCLMSRRNKFGDSETCMYVKQRPQTAGEPRPLGPPPPLVSPQPPGSQPVGSPHSVGSPHPVGSPQCGGILPPPAPFGDFRLWDLGAVGTVRSLRPWAPRGHGDCAVVRGAALSTARRGHVKEQLERGAGESSSAFTPSSVAVPPRHGGAHAAQNPPLGHSQWRPSLIGSRTRPSSFGPRLRTRCVRCCCAARLPSRMRSSRSWCGRRGGHGHVWGASPRDGLRGAGETGRRVHPKSITGASFGEVPRRTTRGHPLHS